MFVDDGYVGPIKSETSIPQHINNLFARNRINRTTATGNSSVVNIFIIFRKAYKLWINYTKFTLQV